MTSFDKTTDEKYFQLVNSMKSLLMSCREEMENPNSLLDGSLGYAVGWLKAELVSLGEIQPDFELTPYEEEGV